MTEQRFVGCLLGLAVGDALGSHFEAQSTDWIRSRFPSAQSLIDSLPEAPWSYTDDTQMAIGVAEALLADGEIVESSLCAAFVRNYDPSRGYGRGARVVLTAMEEGQDYKFWANELFPGGSYGNGAAMRVAPIGLLFHDAAERRLEQARLSSMPTHTHPFGIEGAQLIATAIASCLQMTEFSHEDFFSQLEAQATQTEFCEKLSKARHADSVRTATRQWNRRSGFRGYRDRMFCVDSPFLRAGRR